MKIWIKAVIYILAFGVVFSQMDSAEAGRFDSQKNRHPKRGIDGIKYLTGVESEASDYELVQAVNNRRSENFVEGGSLLVVKILPDDSHGLEHQKWVVRLSNGETMQAVYNLGMCPRVPVRVGDVISMGGQFIWTNKGGLLHWLHHDPRGRRPDGYVFVNGQFYCKE